MQKKKNNLTKRTNEDKKIQKYKNTKKIRYVLYIYMQKAGAIEKSLIMFESESSVTNKQKILFLITDGNPCLQTAGCPIYACKNVTQIQNNS